MPAPPAHHLPYNFQPRPYQQPVWDYMLRGIVKGMQTNFEGIGPRAVCVWHRRAGKDRLALNVAAMASQMRPGKYVHVLPTYRQARKTVWEGQTREGEPMLDAFPSGLHYRNPTQDDMTLWLRCPSEVDRYNEVGIEPPKGATTSAGTSIWQALGSENYDALRGGNTVGAVFSEYAWIDPKAWQIISPILAENGGWAMFISTPHGYNDLWDVLEDGQKDPAWFTEVLTVEDTTRHSGQPVLSEENLAQERRKLSEPVFQREYYCSFESGMEGAYYASLMREARETGKIRSVPREDALGVWTWWDIGIGDATAIWFVQHFHEEIRVIDYLEDSGKGLTHYAKLLKELPYAYEGHVMPHDIKVREFSTGTTRKQTAESLGLRPIIVAPKLSPEDGIDAARLTIPRCVFDAVKCKRGLDALRQHRAAYDDSKDVLSLRPVHDWTSHAADAFRYGALTCRRQQPRPRAPIPVRSRVLGGVR